MPNVRASSGMIGTMRGPMFLSRNSSLKVRTVAMVVATAWLPEPFLSDLYTSRLGSGSGLDLVRRSGRKPPSVRRRSSM